MSHERFGHQIICFVEEETSGDNSAPGKNLLNVRIITYQRNKLSQC